MRVAGFYETSCTNGEGWRSVLFVGGCPHRCKGCQNPQTWDYNYGEKCKNIREYTDNIIKNKNFIDGITLSGGEPFQERNIPHLLELVDEVKSHNLNVWAYSGYRFEELKSHNEFSKLLHKIDVLVDGKFEMEQLDPGIKFRGSKNQRILDIKKSLIHDEAIHLYEEEMA